MSSIPRAVSQPKRNDTVSSTMPDSPRDCISPSGDSLISMSTAFFPGAQTHSTLSDMVLSSSDSVFFYVHSAVLLASSQNNFDSLIPARSMTHNEAIVPVTDVSDVLNVVLHAIYERSCTHYAPTLSVLTTTLLALEKYGLSLARYVRPSTPLFTVLLGLAPTAPIDVYALAAQHDFHDLAVSTSPHLLSFPLHTLEEDTAQKIGPIYLKRLFFLHLGRREALKRILIPSPHPHAPTTDCGFAEQNKLTQAWALAPTKLAWDPRPDMPASTLESALTPLCESLRCEECRGCLQERIRSLVAQWSVVKRTI